MWLLSVALCLSPSRVWIPPVSIGTGAREIGTVVHCLSVRFPDKRLQSALLDILFAAVGRIHRPRRLSFERRAEGVASSSDLQRLDAHFPTFQEQDFAISAHDRSKEMPEMPKLAALLSSNAISSHMVHAEERRSRVFSREILQDSSSTIQSLDDVRWERRLREILLDCSPYPLDSIAEKDRSILLSDNLIAAHPRVSRAIGDILSIKAIGARGTQAVLPASSRGIQTRETVVNERDLRRNAEELGRKSRDASLAVIGSSGRKACAMRHVSLARSFVPSSRSCNLDESTCNLSLCPR